MNVGWARYRPEGWMERWMDGSQLPTRLACVQHVTMCEATMQFVVLPFRMNWVVVFCKRDKLFLSLSFSVWAWCSRTRFKGAQWKASRPTRARASPPYLPNQRMIRDLSDRGRSISASEAFWTMCSDLVYNAAVTSRAKCHIWTSNRKSMLGEYS